MAAGQNDYYNSVAGNVTIVGVTETVALVSKGVNTGFPGQTVFVQFGFQMTIGATQTGLVLTIRRGNAITGTAIYTSGALTVVGGNIGLFVVSVVDVQAGDVASQTYCVTCTQSGGGANNGTVANAWSAVTVG